MQELALQMRKTWLPAVFVEWREARWHFILTYPWPCYGHELFGCRSVVGSVCDDFDSGGMCAPPPECISCRYAVGGACKPKPSMQGLLRWRTYVKDCQALSSSELILNAVQVLANAAATKLSL